MTFSVAHWSAQDDSFMFQYAKEDIIENINAECHVI